MAGDRHGAAGASGVSGVTAPDPDAIMDRARETLREIFGFDDFLPGQAAPLAAILAGRDVLAVMPTGSGKSLLYQLPAVMDAGLDHGLTVVVSPLIALMRDQLQALTVRGVAATTLHSMQDDEEASAAFVSLASGRARLLYLAPERLIQPSTQELLRKNRIRLIAVDEAHCVSHWGHDFRPDYLALREIAAGFGAPVLAVTATAGPRTRDEIARLLFTRPPEVFLRSFARPNLALGFAVRRPGLRQITDFIGRRGDSGVIYVNSRRMADALATSLARQGYDALPYHAGLDAWTRSPHQDAFSTRKGVVMVATIAFGMGVDKPDVRFILHVAPPASVENYYQEIGRAGRDGAPARALTLFTTAELARRWRAPASPETDVAAGDDARRRAMAQLCVATGCRFQALLQSFGEESAPCGMCDHCRGPLRWLRRAGALVQGGRIAAQSRWAALDAVDAGDADDSDAAPAIPDLSSPGVADIPAPLRVNDARLFQALKAERGVLARRLKIAPLHLASDALLRRLAVERPHGLDDPLLKEIVGAADFLRIIREAV
jgi:ATP-dependent DNA helicase RecQ